jgi:glycerate-2-kinase
MHPAPGRVSILAAGKAAHAMAAAALLELGDRVTTCLVVAPHNTVAILGAPHVRTRHAGHPLPDDDSIAAARAAVEHLTGSNSGDVQLALISGGASSLLALPADGISLSDYAATVAILQAGGADIAELNCVRKHIDAVKGGRLAQIARTPAIVVFLISDVVGNAPDVIGSGPFTADPTRYADALEVLQRRDVIHRVPTSVVNHLRSGMAGAVAETPKPGSATWNRVQTSVIADNNTALSAARRHAERLGYAVTRIPDPTVGPADVAGRMLGGMLASVGTPGARSCVLSGGETTVRVRGDGTGGRNLELALAGAIQIDGAPRRVLLSAGTDGIDGNTAAAGAVVDGGSAGRMRAAHIDPRAALHNNDSHTALRAAGDLLVTGATGTNVMDIQILLHDPAS